ncbi:MAG: hypothetical protein ILA34_07885, partial [Bacteroidaceae bacterium]|nr:hypothetical protein [Bacteroidaceae bacterium]
MERYRTYRIACMVSLLTLLGTTRVFAQFEMFPYNRTEYFWIGDFNHAYSHDYYRMKVKGHKFLQWTNPSGHQFKIDLGAGHEEWGSNVSYPVNVEANAVYFYNGQTHTSNKLEARNYYTISTAASPQLQEAATVSTGLEQAMSLRPFVREGEKIPIFNAKELNEELPGLLATGENGEQYADTRSVIAILVNAYQQLREEKDRLEADIAALEQDMGMEAARSKALVSGIATAEGRTGARIDGNSPNPFTRTTTLRMSIPDGTARAVLRITQS